MKSDDGSKILSEITGVNAIKTEEEKRFNDINIGDNNIPSLTELIKRLCLYHTDIKLRKGACQCIFKILINIFYISSDSIITEEEKNIQMKLFDTIFYAVVGTAHSSYETLPLSLPLTQPTLESEIFSLTNKILSDPSFNSPNTTSFSTSSTTSFSGEQIYSLLASLLALRSTPRLIFPLTSTVPKGPSQNVGDQVRFEISYAKESKYCLI